MEVKEALKWFEWADDVYYCSMPNASPNNEFYKQSKEIKNLLKSLESENKKLKKENEAYKGMWEAFKKEFKHCDLTYYDAGCPENSLHEPLSGNMEYFKEEYLGGGE